LSRWLNRLQPWGILLLRLALGASMLYHGWNKIRPANWSHPFSGLEHNAHFIGSLGLPNWLGYVSAFTEFLGGICLLLGFFTRLFAFLVAINMLVAIFAVTIHKGYLGSELSIELAVMALVLLVTGPGKAALDRRIGLS
jgi:putative oxidoreductase